MIRSIKIILILLVFVLTFSMNSQVVNAIDTTTTTPEEDITEEIEEEKEENTEQLEEEITSNSSNSILYVEIFCGIIGAIMLILASKTTN